MDAITILKEIVKEIQELELLSHAFELDYSQNKRLFELRQSLYSIINGM